MQRLQVVDPKPLKAQAAVPIPTPQPMPAPSPISTHKLAYRALAAKMDMASNAPVASGAAASNSTASLPGSPITGTGSANSSPKKGRRHLNRREEAQLRKAQAGDAAGSSGGNTGGQDSNSTDPISLNDPATAKQASDAVSKALAGISPERRRQAAEAANGETNNLNSTGAFAVPAPAAAAAGSYAAAAVSGMVRATISAPRQSITPRRVSTDTGSSGGSNGQHSSASSGLRASKSFTTGRPSSAGSMSSGWSPRNSSAGFAGRLSEGSRSGSILQQFKVPPVSAPKTDAWLALLQP